MKFKLLAALSLLASFGTANAIVINPTSDGSIYTCAGCNPTPRGDGDVLVSGYIQGIVKFSSAGIDGPVESALLSLNPDALPLWGPLVSIYGYGSSIGELDISDGNAGTLLGVLELPPDLTYGEDVFFDVTAFVASTNAPFLAFNLRTPPGGTDGFSSLEFNHGHPSQLIVNVASSSVPEPSTLALFAFAMLAACIVSRRRVDAR